MDIHKAKAHESHIDERIQLAREYCTCRELAAKAKYNLDMILCAHLARIRSEKPSVGVEMAEKMLMEDGFLPKYQTEEVRKYYFDMIKNTARYKGLERIMSAVESKTTFTQSLMRYERENT